MTDTRLPRGVTTVGVTKAIQAILATEDPQGFKTGVRDATGMAVDELKAMVKGARPSTEIEARLDGPISDPLQGMIYVLSVFAEWAIDDLDADSTAYRTWAGEQNGGTR